MKSSIAEIIPIIGTQMGGGFYAGRIRIADQVFAIILAPKSEGERDGIAWNGHNRMVEGALSYCDGAENTLAMAESGSEIAKWARGLTIDGNSDFYLPSQDELEIIYRNLKPTIQENYLYGRSGLNASAVTPTYPYSRSLPAQTQAEAFQAGGAEAFEAEWYWSSTQHADDSGCAWCQYFYGGDQYSTPKDDCLRARAVRRLPI